MNDFIFSCKMELRCVKENPTCFYRLGFEILMVAGAGFEPTTFGL